MKFPWEKRNRILSGKALRNGGIRLMENIFAELIQLSWIKVLREAG